MVRRKLHEIVDYVSHQDEIENRLALFQARRPFFYSRIVDSKAAGNFVKPAESDFYAIHCGRTHFIEAKFSSKHASLSGCFSKSVESHQLATAMMVHRAGGNYWFLFYSSQTGIHEAWDGLYCQTRRSQGMRLDAKDRIGASTDLTTLLSNILQLDWPKEDPSCLIT